jgi:hypothetical protein
MTLDEKRAERAPRWAEGTGAPGIAHVIAFLDDELRRAGKRATVAPLIVRGA